MWHRCGLQEEPEGRIKCRFSAGSCCQRLCRGCCAQFQEMRADAADCKAGVAKVKITPDEPVWLAEYASRNGPSEGALADIYARALVLTNAQGDCFAMVTLDLIEIPDSLREFLLDMALKKYGLRREEQRRCDRPELPWLWSTHLARTSCAAFEGPWRNTVVHWVVPAKAFLGAHFRAKNIE